MMMDRAVFYDYVRNELFNGRLSQGQVDGMEAILNFWEHPPVQPTGEFKVNWDIRSIGWLAYMFATTFHETAYTMQPIDEYGSDEYFSQLYCNREDLGNGPAYGGEPGDGPKFHGRGFVQLTGRLNYKKVTPIVHGFYPGSPDFTQDPAAVKKPEYAAVIMFYGMFNGIFTGLALKNFIGDPAKGQMVDYFHAREIINGLDRAGRIEGYAKDFAQALNRSGAKA
jgi:putative chitinase